MATDEPKSDRNISKGMLTIFLDDGNCSALLVDKKEHTFLSGITHRNIEQLVANALADGYEEVTLCEYSFKRMYREFHIKDLPPPLLEK